LGPGDAFEIATLALAELGKQPRLFADGVVEKADLALAEVRLDAVVSLGGLTDRVLSVRESEKECIIGEKWWYHSIRGVYEVRIATRKAKGRVALEFR
jgi:hypothetical protein